MIRGHAVVRARMLERVHPSTNATDPAVGPGGSKPAKGDIGRSARAPADHRWLETRRATGSAALVVNESDATRMASSRATAASISGSMSLTMSLARRNIAKRTVCTDVAPREVEESLPSLAVHRRPADVRTDGADVDLPARPVSVASHQSGRLLADLDRDVHVAQQHAVRHELGARQIVSLDDDSHRLPFSRRTRSAAAIVDTAPVRPMGRRRPHRRPPPTPPHARSRGLVGPRHSRRTGHAVVASWRGVAGRISIIAARLAPQRDKRAVIVRCFPRPGIIEQNRSDE